MVVFHQYKTDNATNTKRTIYGVHAKTRNVSLMTMPSLFTDSVTLELASKARFPQATPCKATREIYLLRCVCSQRNAKIRNSRVQRW